MHPASLYAKSRGLQLDASLTFAVDVVKETMMSGQGIKSLNGRL